MVSCLVTGVAGFIGSHLAERLIAEGHEVVGIDCFVPYYPRSMKERNLEALLRAPTFRLHEQDIRYGDLACLLERVEYVFHLAAQAGVRSSWGTEFTDYLEHNVLGTQRLLELCKSTRISKFIYASSSSVYGACPTVPFSEGQLVTPVSPYGVTKLAAEHLCSLYHRSFGIPVISLRLFTVYGPRQRPDMAISRFLAASMEDAPIAIYDDGEQTRDFTYVSDVIDGMIAAMECNAAGEVINVGGGSTTSVNQLVQTVCRITGKRLRATHVPPAYGDMRHTYADVTKARKMLHFEPKVDLEEGLARHYEWMRRGEKTDADREGSTGHSRMSKVQRGVEGR